MKASRGEILDCNGNPLVTNRQGNSVVFKYAEFPEAEHQEDRNTLIFSLIKLFEKNDIQWIDRLPLIYKNQKLIVDEDKMTEFKYMVSENMLEMEKGEKDILVKDVIIHLFKLRAIFTIGKKLIV